MGSQEITELITKWADGDQGAADRLFPIIYNELRRLAQHYFWDERPGHTLQPTALVHDVYLRLADQGLRFQDRKHFFAVAATQMRRLLIDHARAASPRSVAAEWSGLSCYRSPPLPWHRHSMPSR